MVVSCSRRYFLNQFLNFHVFLQHREWKQKVVGNKCNRYSLIKEVNEISKKK